MIFILMGLLIFLTFFVYKYYKNDLISPTIWLLFGYDLSVFLAIMNFSEWGDISGKTVFILLIGILSFMFGGIIANNINVEKKNVKCNYLDVSLKFNRFFYFISLLFFVFVVFIDYKYIVNLAIEGGFSGTGYNMMSYARAIMEEGETMPYSIYIPIAFSQALSYLITHELIVKIISKERVTNKILVVFCLLAFFLIMILSSGRTMLMNYILFILIDICIQLKNFNILKGNVNKKILKYGITAIVIILIIFWIIDIFLRASMYGTKRTMWYQISKYTSSSLFALDNYLQKPYFSEGKNYETLFNVYSILNRFGFNFKIGNNALEFTNFSNVSTNIYTALRRYIHDFGYIGMIYIQVIVGFIYHYFYKKIVKKNASFLTLLVFCTFIFAPVFNCIEERFLVNVLSLRSLMIVFFYYIIIFFFQKKKIREEENENDL